MSSGPAHSACKRRPALALLAAAVVGAGAALADLGSGSSASAACARCAAATPAAVAVFPLPGSRLGTPGTQISFRGLPASQLGTITVSGSRTGHHAGKIEPDSDDDGGSFVTRSPFAAGETVTVRTSLNVLGARHGTFRFTIAIPGGNIAPPGKRPTVAHSAAAVERFVSRPDLRPAAVRIVRRSEAPGGDIFLTPDNGPVQYGPMILDPSGVLVWFQPLPRKQQATDLRVQSYKGQPVLTWWQGWMNAGVGHGVDVIDSQHYQRLATVRAGNGLIADHHEFTLTPQGTALIADTRLVRWDARSIGGPKDQGVLDDVIQEIDIPTGLVLFQWDSLDHVPLTASYSRLPKAGHPFDYFHINSIQQTSDGNLLISARNTWAMYEIDHRTGRVLWTLGGKQSSFKMGPGTQTAYQHDAQLYAFGLLSVFDDGAAPAVHVQSRGLLERLDLKRRTVQLVHQFDHRPSLLSGFEGSMQRLGNGGWFIGWGQEPYFTEYNARGQLVYDGRFTANVVSYRAYRFAWSGQPATSPSLALRRGKRAVIDLYASWNGATDVSGWRVLAGSSPQALAPVAGAARRGFETEIRVHSSASYFEVQALSASGQVLASSSVRPGASAGATTLRCAGRGRRPHCAHK